jgi:hypothetical protein
MGVASLSVLLRHYVTLFVCSVLAQSGDPYEVRVSHSPLSFYCNPSSDMRIGKSMELAALLLTIVN